MENVFSNAVRLEQERIAYPWVMKVVNELV
ncbi:hypothetical protein [Desulfogranum marinum]